MGFKKRDFKGTVRSAVLKSLKRGERSKQELLHELRGKRKVAASKRTLTSAIGHLLDEGKIVMEGQRRAARFRRAKPV